MSIKTNGFIAKADNIKANSKQTISTDPKFISLEKLNYNKNGLNSIGFKYRKMIDEVNL